MIAPLHSLRIYYTEQGSAKGTPLIFIHGFPFSSEMWKPQLNALPESIRAITYDVRGLGKSDVLDGQYTIEFFVDDLFELMDYLHIEKAILCGLSMGGYIAQRALQRNPDRISGLILCNTKSEADSNEAKVNRANKIRQVKKQGVKVFAEEFIQGIFSPTTHQSNPGIVAEIERIILNSSPLGLCGCQLALASRTDTTELLPKISIPTLLIAGYHDTLASAKVMESMHQAIRNSEFHILPDSAHISNLENSELFNTILMQFLRENWNIA